MHRLPSLAVRYIHIVTHHRLACNCVVASHTKPAVLFCSTWPIGARLCRLSRRRELRLHGVLRSSLGSGRYSLRWKLNSLYSLKLIEGEICELRDVMQ